MAQNKIVKQLMLIGSGSNSIETTEAFDISGEFDIDSFFGTLNFSLPYIAVNDPLNTSQVTEGIDITRLKKFDTVKLFYGEYSSDPGEVDKTFINEGDVPTDFLDQGLFKVFDGFIDNNTLSKAKDSYSYPISALGTLGLANDRTISYQVTSSPMPDLIELLINSDEDGPGAKLGLTVDTSGLANTSLVANIKGGKKLKELLSQIRDKYAVLINQGGDGIVRAFTPFSIAQNSTVIAWNFDTEDGNVFSIDYGDLTSDKNAVVVFGRPPVYGIALDAIGVQNNAGRVSYLAHENRDLISNEACEEVARNKLLELQKNFRTGFKSLFHPGIKIGDAFTLNDHDRFTGSEVFLMSNISFTISKSDVSATYKGYTHSLTLIPSDIVLSNTGVADVDVIGPRDKDDDKANEWDFDD